MDSSSPSRACYVTQKRKVDHEIYDTKRLDLSRCSRPDSLSRLQILAHQCLESHIAAFSGFVTHATGRGRHAKTSGSLSSIIQLRRRAWSCAYLSHKPLYHLMITQHIPWRSSSPTEKRFVMNFASISVTTSYMMIFFISVCQTSMLQKKGI
jgi:hypothetical protein